MDLNSLQTSLKRGEWSWRSFTSLLPNATANVGPLLYRTSMHAVKNSLRIRKAGLLCALLTATCRGEIKRNNSFTYIFSYITHCVFNLVPSHLTLLPVIYIYIFFFLSVPTGFSQSVQRAVKSASAPEIWIQWLSMPTQSSSLMPTAFAITCRVRAGSTRQKTPYTGQVIQWKRGKLNEFIAS